MSDVRIINADVLDGLAQLESESVQMCCTSPPYWQVRDYGVAGQIGLEKQPHEYIERMVAVFREVWRVLHPSGILWINLGDVYSSCGGDSGLSEKNLVGIPWRTALALQANGWTLRSDVIWHRPNTMPESVTDRPTKSHEYVFLMSKSASYFYDAKAIAEVSTDKGSINGRNVRWNDKSLVPGEDGLMRTRAGLMKRAPWTTYPTRNVRTVWAIPTDSYGGDHVATFPRELAERCIRAGSRIGDTVLDPFAGSGTTLMVARSLGRDSIGIEINTEYVKLIEKRCLLPWEMTTPDKKSEQPSLFEDDTV